MKFLRKLLGLLFSSTSELQTHEEIKIVDERTTELRRRLAVPNKELTTVFSKLQPAGKRTGSTPDALNEEFLKSVALRDVEKINEALDKGTDINVTDEVVETSLIAASMNDHTDILELLLKRGANPDFIGKGGYTALITACVVG